MNRAIRATRRAGAKFSGALTVFLAILVGMGGAAAWSAYLSSASASSSYASGSVSLTLSSGATNTISTAITNIAPTDTLERIFDATNGGTLNWSTFSLSTSASPSVTMTSDTTNGLQMAVDDCSVAWTGTTTYTCSGTNTVDLVSSPIIQGTPVNINGAALTAGATGHYRIKISLPTSATAAMQAQTTTVTFSLLGTQRAATTK